MPGRVLPLVVAYCLIDAVSHPDGKGAMPEGVGELEPGLLDALSRTCVVVPAHNEAAVIGDVLTSLGSLPCRVVVVDDGSTDDTYAICLERPVAVLHHSTNLGQGAALQTGITYALTMEETSFVVTFDADGQHNTDSVLSLISAVAGNGHDVALGTRFARPSDAS